MSERPEKPATDQWGNPIVGTFPRSPDGRPIVTDPSGAVDASGTPAFVPYRFAYGIARTDPKPRDPSARPRGTNHSSATLRGAGVHTLLRMIDEERTPSPEWIAAYEAKGIDRAAQARIHEGWTSYMRRYGFEVRAVEKPCVNDDLEAAGIVDRLIVATRAIVYRDGSGRSIQAGTTLVADIKTGALLLEDRGAGTKRSSANAQLAAYAGSVPYDPISGARSQWETGRPSQDAALAIHLDLDRIKDPGVSDPAEAFTFMLVDIRLGYRYAQAWRAVRADPRNEELIRVRRAAAMAARDGWKQQVFSKR